MNLGGYRHDYYKESLGRFPAGPVSGQDRVLPGGSWVSDSWDERASYRFLYLPYFRGHNSGFRCARSTDPAP